MMETTIVDQQLELDLGADYKDYYFRATKYCNKVISTPPLKFQRGTILNNEGGIGGLVRTALVYVVEKGDLDEGLKATSSYLNEEYSYTNNRSRTHHTKVKLLDDLSSLVGDETPTADFIEDEIDVVVKDTLPYSKATGAATLLGAAGPSSSEEVYPSAHALNGIVETQEELQFLTALGDFNNSIVESSRVLGWDLEHCRKLYFRLKRRAYSKN